MPIPASSKRKYSRVRRTTKPRPVNFLDEPSFRWDVLKTVLPYFSAGVVAIVTMFFTVQAQGSHLGKHDDQIASFQIAKEQRIGQIATITTQQEQQGKDIGEIKSDLKDIRADIKTLLSRSGH